MMTRRKLKKKANDTIDTMIERVGSEQKDLLEKLKRDSLKKVDPDSPLWPFYAVRQEK
jgi:hypothetical protein